MREFTYAMYVCFDFSVTKCSLSPALRVGLKKDRYHMNVFDTTNLAKGTVRTPRSLNFPHQTLFANLWS